MDLIIPPNDVADVFKNIFYELQIKFDCEYLFYHYEYANFKLVLSTQPEWMDAYVNGSLIQNCPLIRVGLQKLDASRSSSVLLRWNDVASISREEKNTVGIRNEFNICNGISFGRRLYGVSEYFGLASNAKNYDFPLQITLRSMYIRSLMNKLSYASTIRSFFHHALQLPFSLSR